MSGNLAPRFVEKYVYLVSKMPGITDAMVEANLVRHLLRGHMLSAAVDPNKTKCKWLVACRQDADAQKEHVSSDSSNSSNNNKKQIAGAGGGGKDGQRQAEHPDSAPLNFAMPPPFTHRSPYTFWLRPAGFSGRPRLAYTTLVATCPSKHSICPYLTVQYYPRGGDDDNTTRSNPTCAIPNIERLATAGCAALEQRIELRDKADRTRRHRPLPRPDGWQQDKNAAGVCNSRPDKSGHSDMLHFLVLISPDQYSVWYIQESERRIQDGVASTAAATAPAGAPTVKKTETDAFAKPQFARSREGREGGSTRQEHAPSTTTDRRARSMISASDTSRSFPAQPPVRPPNSIDSSDLPRAGAIGSTRDAVVSRRSTIGHQRAKQPKYRVRNLAVGDGTERDSMMGLVEWVNAIHGWALGVHAVAVQADLDDFRENRYRPR